jgi:tetratricopeptide (TPR) repeat protein
MLHPDALAAFDQPTQVTGPSLGAAAFVSAMSLWSERAVRRGTVVTGKVLGANIVGVGSIDAKLHAAVRGRADVERVIVPRAAYEQAKRLLGKHGSKIDVVGVATLEQLADAALEAAPRRNLPARHRLAELRREFDEGWQTFGWPSVREHAERLLSVVPVTSADLRVDLLSMLGATQEHLGFPLASLEILDQALLLATQPANALCIPDLALSRLYQHLAMTHRRLRNFGKASRAAARAVMHAKRGRHRDELYKSHGCAGLVELAAGRARHAVTAFERSLELVHVHAPESCSRSHGYLIEARAQAGDEAGARREWEHGLEHLQRAKPSKRSAMSEAWLRTSWGAALWHLGRAPEAAAALDVPVVRNAIERAPLPGLWARRYLGLALLAEGDASEGQALLAASPVAYGPALGANLLFGAHINVLCEAWGVLSRDRWDSDIAGRARAALHRFPEHLQQGTMERARQHALRAVTTNARPRPQALGALHRLITLCNRIA